MHYTFYRNLDEQKRDIQNYQPVVQFNTKSFKSLKRIFPICKCSSLVRGFAMSHVYDLITSTIGGKETPLLCTFGRPSEREGMPFISESCRSQHRRLLWYNCDQIRGLQRLDRDPITAILR